MFLISPRDAGAALDVTVGAPWTSRGGVEADPGSQPEYVSEVAVVSALRVWRTRHAAGHERSSVADVGARWSGARGRGRSAVVVVFDNAPTTSRRRGGRGGLHPVLPVENFTRNGVRSRTRPGALLRELPHGARIFRPAAEALAGRDLDRVVVHEGHYAVTVLPLLRRALPATTSSALHVHNPISRTCLRPELSHHLRRARLVLPVSDFVGARSSVAPGPPTPRCTVHNGADLSRFSPAPDRPDDGRLRLLYVGQVAPHKGVHVLLGALARLGPESERLDVRIVGSAEHQPQEALSDYETSLRGLAARTDARVTFEPYTSQAEVARIYRWADVVVIPSLAEPFGMVAVEAMASGVLVLAAAAGGLPEVVGDAGVLVPGSEEAWVDALRTTDLARARPPASPRCAGRPASRGRRPTND